MFRVDMVVWKCSIFCLNQSKCFQFFFSLTRLMMLCGWLSCLPYLFIYFLFFVFLNSVDFYFTSLRMKREKKHSENKFAWIVSSSKIKFNDLSAIKKTVDKHVYMNVFYVCLCSVISSSLGLFRFVEPAF